MIIFLTFHNILLFKTHKEHGYRRGEIHGARRMIPDHFDGPSASTSMLTFLVLSEKTMGLIAMKFSTKVHVPQRKEL